VWRYPAEVASPLRRPIQSSNSLTSLSCISCSIRLAPALVQLIPRLFSLSAISLSTLDGDLDGPSDQDDAIVFAAVTHVSGESPPDIDAIADASVEVSFSGTGEVTGSIGAVTYENEPSMASVTLSAGVGKEALKYLDIQVIGFTTGTATVKVHYTEAEAEGLDDESLRLYYWDGSTDTWVLADNCSVDTDNRIVSGDIPVSALAGTLVAVGGEAVGSQPIPAWVYIASVVGGVGALLVLSVLIRARRRAASYKSA